MTPEHKFHSYVTTVTIVVMYFIVAQLVPIIDSAGSSSVYLKPLVSILSAFGMYGFFAKVLNSFARNWNWLKRHLLGPTYLNGTWAGKFKNDKGQEKITIEVFEQTISSLTIRGEAFNEDGSTYAQWTSIATSINELNGVLTYTYTCDSHVDYSTFQGVGVFSFERKGAHLPPTFLKGYSADITDGVKTENREKRISEELLEFGEALDLANQSV
ncbi:hypothetical protein [Idiomarina abyssalis]|uniref:hypothetical protein n=1 Tax=Idiomarina abyssalis TaxID=86102 RepID=UPI001C944E02|nr:hypothetical protein [Idiomarina abyssalis]QZN91903.1 hypothetical protein K5X84_05225 [Idiomarina abyssalis]